MTDSQLKLWFAYVVDWLKFLDHKLDVIQASLGNPAEQAKLDQLKQAVDAQRAALAAAVAANQP